MYLEIQHKHERLNRNCYVQLYQAVQKKTTEIPCTSTHYSLFIVQQVQKHFKEMNSYLGMTMVKKEQGQDDYFSQPSILLTITNPK